MKKSLLFFGIGLIFGFALFRAKRVFFPRLPLDSLVAFETTKGRLELLIRQDAVWFQPHEIAESPYLSFSIRKKDYPKLFAQGPAQASFILAALKEDKDKNEILVVLSNNQPDHGSYSETWSLTINPITGKVLDE